MGVGVEPGGLNFLIEYGYDGTDFSGSQVQPGRRTVSGVIEDALERLYARRIRIVPASRTDRGVHARRTGASAEAPVIGGPPVNRLTDALNGILPCDIQVLRCRRMPSGFNARFAALAKEYRYRFRACRPPDVLEARYRAYVPGRLDCELMLESAGFLHGVRSFVGFCRASGGRTGFDCRIESAMFVFDGTRGEFRIKADRFLHQMVRRIAGSLFAVGQGRLSVADFTDAVLFAGPLPRVDIAPPEGLILWKVDFAEIER